MHQSPRVMAAVVMPGRACSIVCFVGVAEVFNINKIAICSCAFDEKLHCCGVISGKNSQTELDNV
jgi:hypothetical protein